MLRTVLEEYDLAKAGAVLCNNKISGQAFLAVMNQNDLQEIGITDQLTLRRLLDLQA